MIVRVQLTLGVNLTHRYDPADTWRPWMGHWFGVQRRDMADLTLGQIVAMTEFVDAQGDGG